MWETATCETAKKRRRGGGDEVAVEGEGEEDDIEDGEITGEITADDVSQSPQLMLDLKALVKACKEKAKDKTERFCQYGPDYLEVCPYPSLVLVLRISRF